MAGLAGFLAASALLAPGAFAMAPTRGATDNVIITGLPGAAAAVSRAVRAAGGSVTRQVGVIDGVVARVPSQGVAWLRTVPGVRSVTSNVPGHFLSTDKDLAGSSGTASGDFGSLNLVSQLIGAQTSWKNGYTGKGIGIAVIDSGVAPVAGLTSGNVVSGPDLSFDSQDPELTQNDGFGHGTHMVSIMAGRDTAESTGAAYAADAQAGQFVGIAPDARVVSLKVGAADGAADVSQVIAAIDWVVQHAQDGDLNIRVLNLSYGTDSGQTYDLDPLAYAVESAWQHGIVVVAAGGNDGTSVATLSNPAYDPMVLAVGAEDPAGTLSSKDDVVPEFANHGTQARHVDLVAPGVHILGLRDPGSAIDENNPSARVGDRLFRGSGTSQATAITSGAVALLLQSNPSLTPDQAKSALIGSAAKLKVSKTDLYKGSGLIQVDQAQSAKSSKGSSGSARVVPGTGLGTLEAARGGTHVTADGVALQGEQDIFGNPVNTAVLAACSLAATCWVDGTFNGASWSGASWSDASWSGASWGGARWSGARWSGASWSGASWSGASWSSARWSGARWSGASWSGARWSGASWSGARWSGASWS